MGREGGEVCMGSSFFSPKTMPFSERQKGPIHALPPLSFLRARAHTHTCTHPPPIPVLTLSHPDVLSRDSPNTLRPLCLQLFLLQSFPSLVLLFRFCLSLLCAPMGKYTASVPACDLKFVVWLSSWSIDFLKARDLFFYCMYLKKVASKPSTPKDLSQT